MPKAPIVRSIASVLAVLFGFALTYLLIYKNEFIRGDGKFDLNVNRIGNQMLATGEHGYALPFEVVSMLLLAAMVGCIVIALKAPSRPSPKGKATDPQGPDNLKVQDESKKVDN